MPAGRPITELTEALGYDFDRPDILERALTHASAASQAGESYQRLEFLGDRVLGLVLVDFLMRQFPDEAEGHLAKRLARLADRHTLAGIARTLSLADWIRVADGGQSASVAENDSVMADVLEAVFGAVYRDGGLQAARAVIEPLWTPIAVREEAPPVDAKTALQEWAQSRALPLPQYSVVSRTGPDHSPIFTVEASVRGHDPVQAEGGSKRAAEQAAAAALLEAAGAAP